MLTIFRPNILNLSKDSARKDLILLRKILLEALHGLLSQLGVTIALHRLQSFVSLLVFLIELLRKHFWIPRGLDNLLRDHVTFLGWPLKLDDTRFVKCAWIRSARFLEGPITFSSISNNDRWWYYFLRQYIVWFIDCRALNYILKVDFYLEFPVFSCFTFFVEWGKRFITAEGLLHLLRLGFMITDE